MGMTVRMCGGGPYGFRLYGGETEPLIVAKIRKGSKASEAGLIEGDELVAINGRSCRGMNHQTAMGLVEQSGDTLEFQITRSDLQLPARQPEAPRQEERHTETQKTFEHRQIHTQEHSDSSSGFNVSKNNFTKPWESSSTWKPVKAPAVSSSQMASSASFNVKHTVTQSYHSENFKENVAPSSNVQSISSQPSFHVKTVTTTHTQKWQPTNVFKPQPQSQPPAAPQPKQIQPRDEHVVDGYTYFPFDVKPFRASENLNQTNGFEPQIDDDIVSKHLSKILHEGPLSDSESGNESPGTFWMKKKKIFADSSFYDDPEHKYPTIEEQIKMARKVALSLISPANKNARGHKMFLKRKQKSRKWTTGMGEWTSEYEMSEEDVDDGPAEEKYFNPNPWKGTHTWQPPSQLQYPQPIQQPQVPQFHPVPDPAPPPPPMPVFAPRMEPVSFKKHDTEDGGKPLSSHELEKMRLHSQKSKHTQVAPQLAFSLADDLRKMKGKGGRLFAKRREKSEKWVVGETFGQADADPNIMQKIVHQAHMENPTAHHVHHQPPAQSSSNAPPVNRLQEMINPPKPSMTPWDACADYGDVDKAFQHLDGYMALKKGDYKTAVAQCLDKAAQRSYMTPFRPAAKTMPVNTQPEPTVPVKAPKVFNKESEGPDVGLYYGANKKSASMLDLHSTSQSKGFRPVRFNASKPGQSSLSVSDARSERSLSVHSDRQEVSNLGGFSDL